MTRKKIPVVRITVKPDFYFYTDVLMGNFDNDSIPLAKADAVHRISKGVDNITVKHTKEIVWIYEDEYIKQ